MRLMDCNDGETFVSTVRWAAGYDHTQIPRFIEVRFPWLEEAEILVFTHTNVNSSWDYLIDVIMEAPAWEEGLKCYINVELVWE